LAAVERTEEIIPAPPMLRDFRGVALSEKKQVTEQCNELMLAVRGIHTT
jgi:adenosyl cobinamide kinase/adenosyl cobinamide phosphate guanylyltransferase